MRKIFGVFAALALSGGAGWAAPDRSALSYEENVIINTTCGTVAKQNNAAFQSCVLQQVAALRDHPSPDLSGVSAARTRAIDVYCGHFRRKGIAPYNDCVTKLLATLAAQPEEPAGSEDELTPKLGKVFTEDAEGPPAATPVAVTNLPKPAGVLAERPNQIEQKELSSAEVFKKVRRSVFIVVATRSVADARSRNTSQGSGIAVAEHLLLTNCHVVKDRPLIKLIQDGKRTNAKLVAADYVTDRCVLEADEITFVPVAGVRPVDSLGIGEHVYAIGAPLSQELTLSEGLISGVRHGAGRTLVQTSAAVGHGSSGGGLFDERGNLVGITTLASFANMAQNLNFAIAAAEYWH
jgi:S1-C subfamily serine protease